MDLVHMDLSNFVDEYLSKNFFLYILINRSVNTYLRNVEIQLFVENKEQILEYMIY